MVHSERLYFMDTLFGKPLTLKDLQVNIGLDEKEEKCDRVFPFRSL